jgi:hypothetical protein
MENRYLPKLKGKGRWQPQHLCQPTDYLRNKYYAFLKHRCQARHRSEDYTLTWDDWHSAWSDQDWAQRGRSRHSKVLGRIDWDAGWHKTNVRVMSRREHFDIRLEYYAKQ